MDVKGTVRAFRNIAFSAAWLCASVSLATTTAAQPASDPRPDHDIGSQWPFEHTFATPPPRGRVTPGSSCEVADAFMTGRGVALADLFAQDGVFMGPYDVIYRGPAQIALWFGQPSAHEPGKPGDGPPRIIPLSFVDSGDECFVEVATLHPSSEAGKPDVYRLAAIDHFTIGPDRKIERLVIYIRPDTLADTIKQGAFAGRSQVPIPPSASPR